MSSEVEDKVVKKVKEPLFSKKNKKLIYDPLDDSNPISVQVLGICSALAITTQLMNAFIMSVSVLVVLVLGNLTISLLRNSIPGRIRIIVQLVVVATLVTLVNEFLMAYVFEVQQKVGVFVGLIITNCIIMGRFEAFAMGNKPGPSVFDAIGNSIGYAWILVAVAFFRELFGSGKLMGYPIFGDYIEETGLYSIGYVNNNLMILPPMALILVAIIIWIQRSRNKKLIEQN